MTNTNYTMEKLNTLTKAIKINFLVKVLKKKNHTYYLSSIPAKNAKSESNHEETLNKRKMRSIV